MKKHLFLLVCVVFLANSCAKKSGPDFGFITFYYGDIKVVQSGDTVKPKLKMLLKSGDSVRTYQKARLDLQIKDVGVVRINENSYVELDRVLKEAKDKVNMELNKGQVLCKLMKLNKAQDFEVLTPTAVVGVRGTTFLVDASEKKKSEVAVADGSVEVASKDDPDKKSVVKQDETASVDKSTGGLNIIKGIKLDNLKELNAIKNVEILKNVDKIDVSSLKNMSFKNLKNLNIKDLKGLGDEFKSLIPSKGKKSGESSGKVEGTQKKIEETKVQIEEKKEVVEKKVEEVKKTEEKAKEEIDKTKKKLKNMFK
ncbi:MAG: FecR family protein [bacterium]|nr:FecR family protein [bacterium]